MSFVIALDGPTASGKGTIGKKLAAHFSLVYLDTGLLYRAVAYKMLTQKKDPHNEVDAEACAQSIAAEDCLDVEALRAEEVSAAASVVSAHIGVRKALLDMQRNFAKNVQAPYGGALLDGRDIGTVVCPDAPVKVFITASEEVRAQRRFAQLQEGDFKGTYDDVLKALKERDIRDKMRNCSPLVPASDALVVDTSDLGIDDVLKLLIEKIAGKYKTYARG